MTLAVLLVGATALLASGRSPRFLRRRRGPGAQLAVDGAAMSHPVASLPPVLLPAVPSPQDVDAVRFGLGLRGYRMDQVDEVLDRLAAALAQRDAQIEELRSELRTPPDPAG